MTAQYLNHRPKSEEEVLGILPKGKYEALVKKIEVKSGRQDPQKRYFVATVEVHNPSGSLQRKEITTWLALDYLLKHLYDACNQQELYNKTQLSTEDCEGHVVYVEVDIDEPNEKFNRPKNSIKDFYAFDQSSKRDFNDDIDF